MLEINGDQPLAWAYSAVIAHLEGDFDAEQEMRQRALSRWKNNPEVDHLIGRKLSQNYRFREGSVYQRRALTNDSNYLPARMALASDLLRLGEEKEGWDHAAAVKKQDGYHVEAHNLATLRGHLERFVTLEAPGW